jgi:PAS domain-containing protein
VLRFLFSSSRLLPKIVLATHPANRQLIRYGAYMMESRTKAPLDLSAPTWSSGRLQTINGEDVRHRGLLDAAPDAIVLVNQSGTIVLVNAQTERLFGYGLDELIGKPT